TCRRMRGHDSCRISIEVTTESSSATAAPNSTIPVVLTRSLIQISITSKAPYTASADGTGPSRRRRPDRSSSSADMLGDSRDQRRRLSAVGGVRWERLLQEPLLVAQADDLGGDEQDVEPKRQGREAQPDLGD